MADQNPQHGRRPHFYRGRRGHDRRANDRRGTQQPQEPGNRDHVDVEQIMREIRTRISQRHGIELTTQQIQELAARRLEAILDPRTVKPSLLEQIRHSAATPADAPAVDPETTYSFEESTIYESHRGLLRSIRRLLNPLLKLFFNPNPLIHAVTMQTRVNKAAATRDAERDRRQAEWNSLHYEILQRLVLEVTRASLETQQLSLRVEALSTKVDFAERRARSIEGTLNHTKPVSRPADSPPPAPPVQPRTVVTQDPPSAPAGTEVTGEGSRRRRRRRRGRRSPVFNADGTTANPISGATTTDLAHSAGAEVPELLDGEEGEDEAPDVDFTPSDEPSLAAVPEAVTDQVVPTEFIAPADSTPSTALAAEPEPPPSTTEQVAPEPPSTPTLDAPGTETPAADVARAPEPSDPFER